MLKNEMPRVLMSLPGPIASEILRRRSSALSNAMHTGYPCVIKRGEGAIFEDPDGNIFLDWVGGIGVLNVGYTNQNIIEAVIKQSKNYFHAMMSVVTHDGYVKLAEMMNNLAPVVGEQKKTMFANSGAEAVENAIKIAKNVTGRPNIIVFSGAFHGRTTLTMAMTAKKAYSVGMGPFPDGVYRAEFPDLYRAPEGKSPDEAIAYYIKKLRQVFVEATPSQHVAAIVVEPVQGEGGFVPAPIEWIREVRKICDEKGIFLIADEIQTGFARSGKMFCSEYWKEAGAPPDILVAGKSIAGGLPLSAVVARSEVMDNVTPGTIGGTFSGNAVACAAAIAVINEMKENDYMAKATQMGDIIINTWKGWQQKYEVIGDVRGIGAMLGIEFVVEKKSKAPNPDIVKVIIENALKKGLLLMNSGIEGNVIRFLGPLCMTEAQLERGLEIFEEAIQEALNL